MPVYGEVLIADLLRLGRGGHRHLELIGNGEPWSLHWSEGSRRWRGSGPVIGPGVPWWSEEVTYRHLSAGWPGSGMTEAEAMQRVLQEERT